MKKICFVASSGGHWEELMCLKPIMLKYDSCYVTESGGQADDAEVKSIHCVRQINRKEKLFFFKFIGLSFQALKILLTEKPDVIITTGALIAFPFCFFGRLLRKKIVYIESFARINEKSLTGRLVYPFADLFVVQWEEMLKCYPKATYIGGIF